MSIWLQSALVFFAALLIDVFYVLWFRFSSLGYAHRAAAMSSIVGGLALFGTYIIVAHSIWMAIPDVAGLYCGTLVGLRIGKRWEKDDKKKP